MERHAMMSVEEFERAADTLGSCELIKGEIVDMMPGGYEHSVATSRIFLQLANHCAKHKIGRALTNEVGVVTESFPGTVRGVDALYISYKRLPKGARFPGFLRIAPELVAEVKALKDTWKTMATKVVEYHKSGVDLVWVADPKTRTVRVFPKDGAPRELRSSDMITGGKALPKFKCKVARFFED